jgi:5-methyltetrahydropteroyltriglutamate--homocysteine methyltransferase
MRAIELQQEAGVDVFTDGEYYRPYWADAVRAAIEGLVPAERPSGPMRFMDSWRGDHADVATSSVGTLVPMMVVGEKMRQVRRLAGREAAFLKAHAPGPWKVTMPGPASAVGPLYRQGITDRVYPTRREFITEIAAMIRGEIAALIEDGCSYIQLDSLLYVERVADKTVRGWMVEDGEDPETYLDDLIAHDNAALEGARREGVTVGLHMCRGNNRSAWHAEGSYEPIAEKAFSQLNVDRFLLEYDTERAGGFEPLRFVPKGKMVVLGLISSKLPALESIDDLQRRIDEASKYVPIENLAISPQCGFASTMAGNILTWDEMKAKLELVAEVARKVWG